MNYNYSVIVPFRDRYELLLKAIESIPDRADIQIIIVDNAPQPLPESQIPVKESATVLFATSSPTKGAGHARNVGLTLAKGLYLVFLDSDDYFTPNAFESFDKYLDREYDIVYFDASSIKLSDNSISKRHNTIHSRITDYIATGNEDPLRYDFVKPYCKMVRASLVLENGIQFGETRVANDSLFSVRIGHKAKTITASSEVVYVITEGGIGTSLTKTKSAENEFIRFSVIISRYKFLKAIGKQQQCPRIYTRVGRAFLNYGIKESFKWLKYAHKQGVRLLVVY